MECEFFGDIKEVPEREYLPVRLLMYPFITKHLRRNMIHKRKTKIHFSPLMTITCYCDVKVVS